MKLKYIYIAFVTLCFLFLIAGSSSLTGSEFGGSDEPTIKFSHALHAELSACEDCHSSVPTAENLNTRLLPVKEKCAECHDVNDTDACLTCHVSEDYKPLRTPAPSEIIFSHKQHVGEKAECVLCHAGIKENESITMLGTFNPSMTLCSTCHGETKLASNACETCHTNTADLRPDNHLASNFSRTHKFMAGSPTADCMTCHDNSSCEECHNGTTSITESNTANNFYTPYGGQALYSGRKLQKIQKAHELNYRFTHGIDAKSKSADCSSCHQVETFCGECHTGAGEDYALAGVIPTSHGKSNFITLGVGSGGGLHAQLARRDIESCASCHDTQGSDPACMLCHTDTDGLKGTNPKTHKTGFFSSVNGDWHTDAGSMCFSCHTDANAKPDGIAGLGFCGYCHGAK